jgi:CRP-like cAMP-binding protein
MELSEYGLFEDLSPDEVDSFTAIALERRYGPGERLIAAGGRGTEIYFLLAGELRVFRPNSGGARELAILSPPAVVGEVEFLTGKPRMASVEAVTEARVLAVPFDALRERLKRGDTATLKVMSHVATVLAQRLHSVTEKLTEIEARTRGEELDDFRKKLFGEWSV